MMQVRNRSSNRANRMSTNDVNSSANRVALRALGRPRTSGAVTLEAWFAHESRHLALHQVARRAHRQRCRRQSLLSGEASIARPPAQALGDLQPRAGSLARAARMVRLAAPHDRYSAAAR